MVRFQTALSVGENALLALLTRYSRPELAAEYWESVNVATLAAFTTVQRAPMVGKYPFAVMALAAVEPRGITVSEASAPKS